MNISLSNIVSVSDIQRNYRKVFDRAKKTKEPILVLRNNKPWVVIIDFKTFAQMQEKLGDKIVFPRK